MAEKKNNNAAALAKMLGNLGVTNSGQTTKKVGSTFRAKNPFGQPTAVAAATAVPVAATAVPVAATAVPVAATATAAAASNNASDPYNFNGVLQFPFLMRFTTSIRYEKHGEPRRDNLINFERGKKQEKLLEPLAWVAIRILSQIPHAWLHDLSDAEQSHTIYLINKAAYNNVIATDPVLREWMLKRQNHATGFRTNFSLLDLQPKYKAIAKQLGEQKRAIAGSYGGRRNYTKRSHKKRNTRKNRR